MPPKRASGKSRMLEELLSGTAHVKAGAAVLLAAVLCLTVSVAHSDDSVEMAIRFREFLGTFMEHCHNTQHEDHAMLLRWDIKNPGQVKIMPTPMPTWDGVTYLDSFALLTARTGSSGGSGSSGSGSGGSGR
jgi:hypothetical protein